MSSFESVISYAPCLSEMELKKMIFIVRRNTIALGELMTIKYQLWPTIK